MYTEQLYFKLYQFQGTLVKTTWKWSVVSDQFSENFECKHSYVRLNVIILILPLFWQTSYKNLNFVFKKFSTPKTAVDKQ